MPIFKSNKNGSDIRLDYTVNVDSSLDPTSKNPIQNKVVAEEINAANENISSNSQKIAATKTAIEALTNTVNNIPSTGNVDIASTDNAGIVKPDGETITIDEDGTIHSNGTGNINVDDCMSETSEKIGTVYSGEKVTVVMSYAEGWTKVTWNGKIGYIKTSLLQ